MFFNEDHLKITKVRTADGVSPVIGSDGRVVTKVVYAPLNPTTKKTFEEQNTRLPTALKMKIEVIKGYTAQANHVIDTPEADELKKKILELQAENDRLSQQLTSGLANQNGSKTASNEGVKELNGNGASAQPAAAQQQKPSTNEKK